MSTDGLKTYTRKRFTTATKKVIKSYKRHLLLWKRKMINIRNFIILYLICMLFGCLYFEEMY